MFAGWMVVDDFINTSYTAAAIFHPAFLFAGFFFSRAVDDNTRRSAAFAVLAGVALLALWSLGQALSGAARAHADFETPNTLAAVLNLALAPVLFRIAYGERRRALVGIAVLLTAALAATLSRGGFIALAAGLTAAMLLFRAWPRKADMVRVLAVLALGAAIGTAVMQMPRPLMGADSTVRENAQHFAVTSYDSVASRIELYRLALSAAGEHPWLGTGYLGFRSLFEARRAEVPSYPVHNVTYFVHQDYLQTLVELGVPGLAALLALVTLPFGLALRKAHRTVHDPRASAALAGVATMAIHALGDFPFYVPVCLLLFGGLLGEVDTRLAGEQRGMPPRKAVSRMAVLAGMAVAAVLTLAPALAELAVAHGERSWRSGDARTAAWGFELARRLQPRDWRYHWYAGQFWYGQAQSGNAAAAPLADQAFAAAMRADPAEPRPLLARVATQLRFAPLLDHAAAATVLRDWADRALALAPLNPAVRRDHAAALAQLADRP